LRYRTQRHTVIARSGAISGTGLRRAAARFQAPVRTSPRGRWAARRDSGRRCCVRLDSILGAGSRRAALLSRSAVRLRAWVRTAPRSHRAARRDFGAGSHCAAW